MLLGTINLFVNNVSSVSNILNKLGVFILNHIETLFVLTRTFEHCIIYGISSLNSLIIQFLILFDCVSKEVVLYLFNIITTHLSFTNFTLILASRPSFLGCIQQFLITSFYKLIILTVIIVIKTFTIIDLNLICVAKIFLLSNTFSFNLLGYLIKFIGKCFVTIAPKSIRVANNLIKTSDLLLNSLDSEMIPQLLPSAWLAQNLLRLHHRKNHQ